MNNNDVLRRLRYALNIKDKVMLEMFNFSGNKLSQNDIALLLLKEEDEKLLECSDEDMSTFLDGLITNRRGPSPNQPPAEKTRLTNNVILKKIRIALEFKENDMLKVLYLGGLSVSKSELSALFRKQDHKNYKPCGDQFLRYFLKGLTIKLRPTQE